MAEYAATQGKGVSVQAMSLAPTASAEEKSLEAGEPNLWVAHPDTVATTAEAP